MHTTFHILRYHLAVVCVFHDANAFPIYSYDEAALREWRTRTSQW